MNLNAIGLGRNEVADLTPLHKLENLGMFLWEYNPISDEQLELLREALPDLSIQWGFYT
jgi:hypothetical protein